jgi:hypothetical protein
MNPLVEPGVSESFFKSLKSCHEIKVTYQSLCFNIILFFSLVAATVGFLYYKYKTKPTPKDKKYKMEMDRQYILGKLKSLQLEKHQSQGMITQLPMHSFA